MKVGQSIWPNGGAPKSASNHFLGEMVTMTMYADESRPVEDRGLQDDEYYDLDEMLQRLPAAAAQGSIAGSFSLDVY
jgi:hypothetical protein